MSSKITHRFYESNKEIAIIDLTPEVLGGTEALDFSNTINELADAGVKCVVVDLGKVGIMNSSGLGMLVSGYSSLKKKNINLILANLPKKVEKLLEMTHLINVFDIQASVEGAIKSCE